MSAKNILNKDIIHMMLIFFLAGVLHVILYDIDFTNCSTQLIYSVLVMSWGLTINRRIIDHRVRRILNGIVISLILYFLLQICKYRLFMSYGRYFWFGYYIPMMLNPLLIFYLSVYMNIQEDEKLNWKWFLTTIPAIILGILILTNDFHELFCRLEGLQESIDGAHAGIVFYLYWAYAIFLWITSIVIILKKRRIAMAKERICLFFCSLTMCLLLAGTYALGIKLRIAGKELWNIGEIFSFCMICMIETLIQIGLIPANTRYKWFFDRTYTPAVIRNRDGECEFITKGADEILFPKKEVVIQSAPISGGSVTWMVDLSAVNALSRQIEDATEQIKERNNYLRTQNSLLEEKAAVDARNKVYDRIAHIVRTQISKIEELLCNGADEEFSKRLKKITVYNTYIKRRGNLELLRESAPMVYATEIATSISETVQYLKLNDMEVVVSLLVDGQISADVAILTYDFFEMVVEKLLEEAPLLSVVLNCKDGILSLRMITNLVCFQIDEQLWRDELKKAHGVLNVCKTEQDTILVLEFRKEGDA